MVCPVLAMNRTLCQGEKLSLPPFTFDSFAKSKIELIRDRGVFFQNFPKDNFLPKLGAVPEEWD